MGPKNWDIRGKWGFKSVEFKRVCPEIGIVVDTDLSARLCPFNASSPSQMDSALAFQSPYRGQAAFGQDGVVLRGKTRHAKDDVFCTLGMKDIVFNIKQSDC